MSVSAIDQISQGSLPPSIAAGGALPGGAGATLPPAVAQDPRVQAAQAQAAKADAEQADIAKRKEAEMAPINADIEQKNKDLGAMAAKGPDQQALPENNAKHMDPKQLSDAFSTFMTLGALAGLLSRTPMTAALNNMTAAINGVQAGDQAQYDQSYKEFQQNYQKAVDQNKAKLEEYNRVFANNKMTLDEKIREAGLVANKYGDELVRAEARNNNYKGIQSAIDASVKSQESAQQHKDTLDHWHQEHTDKMIEHADSMAQQKANSDEAVRFHNLEAEHWKAEAAAKVPPNELRGVPPKVQQEYRGNDKLVGDLKGMKEALEDPVIAERIKNHGIRSNIPYVGNSASERDFAMQGLTDEQKDKMQQYFTLESLYRAGEFDKGGVQMTKVKREILDPIYKLGGGYNTKNISRAIDENIPQFQKMNRKIEAEYPALQKVGERLRAADAPPAATAAAPYSDADKEARYQAWKAQHGNQ